MFSHLDPLPDSSDEELSTRSETEPELIEKIEVEFENVEGTSSQSMSAKNNNTTNTNTQQCPACGSDLSSYPDPNYCLDYGNKL